MVMGTMAPKFRKAGWHHDPGGEGARRALDDREPSPVLPGVRE